MPFAVRPTFAWRLRTRSLALGRRTLVMGILNVTPDSFSDGGELASVEVAIARGVALLDQGADLLDVGGESTRPNATALPPREEQERVLPVIAGVLAARPGAVLSIDTYHAETARLAVEAGAEIVNDVSGSLWDPAMAAACAGLGCGTILMHTRGRPAEWGGLPGLAPDEVMPLVLVGLAAAVERAVDAGVEREAIVLDPGFGFGKLGEENYALLARFEALAGLGFPLLAGISRKGFLGRSVAVLHGGRMPAAGERRHPTTAANVAAVLAGAHILRVHDLLPALEAAAVADAILAAG